MTPRLILSALALCAPSGLTAQTVLADIAPVASLVAQVTDGAGAPEMIGGGVSDPHGGTLRPSDARALSRADVVFWVGPGLTPWLQAPLDRLASEARVVALSEVEGVVTRPFRDTAVFAEEGHDDHAHDDHDHDDHGHDDHAHDDHAAEDAHAHDDHAADDHDDHAHDHDHGDLDPHLWLDPANARAFVAAIAATLTEVDPDNAALYAANAAAATARLDTLEAEIAARLTGVAPRFVMDHDALGHFEDRFGVSALAAVSDGQAARPGPRRVDAVRRAAREAQAVCLLVEPGQGARPAVEGLRVVEIDPLGLTFEPGPALYGQVLTAIAETLADCAQ